MSVVAISYGSLQDAAGEARDVARRMGQYADEIASKVYNKLNNYNGEWSSNLADAAQKASQKITILRTEQSNYQRYASDLEALKTRCESTDVSVKENIAGLTATFKTNHGISNNEVINNINYFFTSLGNTTSFGRWLDKGWDMQEAGSNYLKESIKEWYNYEGGKALIKGVLTGILEVALAIAAIVGAVLSGGALLVVIAGVIGGIIALADGITNLVNEARAYNETQNGDPASGVRKSNLNTLTDTLRTESDDKLVHGIANTIDIVDTACTAITFVSGLKDLAKKGYKWATGNMDDISKIKIKDVFSKEGLSSIWNKLKTTTSNGWTDISTAVKNKSMDFLDNLKGEFWKGDKEALDFKDGLDVAKNWMGLGKDLIESDFKAGDVAKTILGDVVLPCTSIAEYGTKKETGEIETENITLDNLWSVLSTPINLGKDIAELGETQIKKDVLEKLAQTSKVNISIPEIYIPEIKINMAA